MEVKIKHKKINLHDPRQYSEVFPESNMLLQIAQCIIENTATEEELVQAIRNTLEHQNDQLINVALNLAPNVEVSQLIWQALHLAINNVITSNKTNKKIMLQQQGLINASSSNDDTQVNELGVQVVAIPVILVLGSKSKVKLAGKLPVGELNQLLHKANIFTDNNEVFFSGKLIDPELLATIKPSQIYYWVRNLQQPKLWLPIDLNPEPIHVNGEGVFLRFLIGVIGNHGNNMTPNINHANVNKFLMQLMDFVHANLTHANVTLFAIPFAPKFLSEAYNSGLEKRTEIALHVAFSNIVKQIKEQGHTPKAKMTTIPDAIETTIYCDDSKLKEVSLWNLSKYSNFDSAVITISDLLADLGVELET